MKERLPCREEPSNFEPESFVDSAIKVRRSREGCARCEVRAQCLAWALVVETEMLTPEWRKERPNPPPKDPLWIELGERVCEAFDKMSVCIGFRPTTVRVRDTAVMLAGTTPEERKAVEALPLVEQHRTLERQFREKATTGPYRVVTELEYVRPRKGR